MDLLDVTTAMLKGLRREVECKSAKCRVKSSNEILRVNSVMVEGLFP